MLELDVELKDSDMTPKAFNHSPCCILQESGGYESVVYC